MAVFNRFQTALRQLSVTVLRKSQSVPDPAIWNPFSANTSRHFSTNIMNVRFGLAPLADKRGSPCFFMQTRGVSTKQRRKWKVRKYHFKLRLKRTMRKMRVPYVSSKPRGQVKKKPILYDFRPYLRRKLKRAER